MLTLAFFNVYLYEESEQHARRWLELIEAEAGPGHPRTHDARIRLARALRQQDRLREAEGVIRAVVDERPAGASDAVSLSARAVLGDVISAAGRYEEAEALLRDLINDAERAFGRFDHVTVRPVTLLARTLDNRSMHGGVDEQTAQALLAEAIELLQRVIADEQRTEVRLYDGIHARTRLADCYARQQRFDDAAAAAADAHETATARLGPEHPLSLAVESRLVNALSMAGRREEAGALMMRLIERRRRIEGDSTAVIVAMADSLPLLDAAGEWERALEYAEILAERFAAGGAHDDFAVQCRIWLPYLHTRLGDLSRAGPAIDELIAMEDDLTDRHKAGLYYAHGMWWMRQGATDRARARFEQALDHCGDAPHDWPKRDAVLEAMASVSAEGEP